MLHVDACIAERGCGAAALHKVIVSPSLDFVMIIMSSFYLLSFLHSQSAIFFWQSPLSAVFGSVDPCLVGLVVAFKWIFGIFKSCLRNSLTSYSHLFLGLPIALLVLYLVLSSGFQSAAFLSHLSLGEVAILSANFHFIFCEPCSSIESLRFPFFLWLQCFSICIQSSLLLRSMFVPISSSASSADESSLSTSL